MRPLTALSSSPVHEQNLYGDVDAANEFIEQLTV